jgi:hypothetical protein
MASLFAADCQVPNFKIQSQGNSVARHLTLAVCQTGPIQRQASRTETVGRLVSLLEQAAASHAETGGLSGDDVDHVLPTLAD